MTNTSKTDSGKRGKGRPAIISNESFIQAHRNGNSIDEIINSIPELKAMDVTKAKLYVSMRAATLRRKDPSLKLKTFPRGRKRNAGSVSHETSPQMSVSQSIDVEPKQEESDQVEERLEDSNVTPGNPSTRKTMDNPVFPGVREKTEESDNHFNPILE